MQHQPSERSIGDSPSNLDKGDAQILIANFWDQPEAVWEKAPSARDAPVSLSKFCHQLTKLETNFGEALVKLGQDFKEAAFNEGPTLTKSWLAFVQQIISLGEEFGRATLLMSSATGLLKKMETILEEPVKLGKTEIAASKKHLAEQTKIFEKVEKEVEKMKEHENSKKLKKQKSGKIQRSPKALTNSKPIKVWTGEDAWIEGLSDRKVIVAEALMAEFRKARAAKNESDAKHKQTLTNALNRYQSVDKERVHTLRDVMYGALASHNSSLTASYKSALLNMRKVKETSHQDDLLTFSAAHASHKPCPWIQQEERVAPNKQANAAPAVLEAKRMIAPKRTKDSEQKGAEGKQPEAVHAVAEAKAPAVVTPPPPPPPTTIAAATTTTKAAEDLSFGSQAYFASLVEVNKSATLTPMSCWGRTHYLTAQANFAKEYAAEKERMEREAAEKAAKQQKDEEEADVPELVDVTKGANVATAPVQASLRNPSDMPPLIIDNGSAYFKAGFAGEQAPSFVVSSNLAYYPHLWNPENRAQFLGSSSLHTGPALLVPPSSVSVNNSIFNDDPNWDDVEAAWEYLFSRLTPTPEEHFVMMTQPCMAPLKLKKTMEEILYEKFGIQGLFIAEAPVLSAYAYGQSSGLVVEVGHSSAQVVPVVDGYLIDAHVRRVKHLGGHQDTRRVLEYFRENPEAQEAAKYPTAAHQYAMAQTVKERLCACPASKNAYEDELAICDDVKGFLGGQDPENLPAKKQPQGPHSITLHKALLMCGEVTFSPSEVLRDNDASIVSLQQLCKDVVAQCAVDVRNQLLANIFLSGQLTTMPGFEERFRQELRHVLPYASVVNVFGSSRRFASWTGGSVLACIDDFRTEWRMRDEWER